MSKLSFQYGLSVFLITEVVLVCSPDIVATANGSGNPIFRLSQCWFQFPKHKGLTEHIAFVETIRSDYYRT